MGYSSRKSSRDVCYHRKIEKIYNYSLITAYSLSPWADDQSMTNDSRTVKQSGGQFDNYDRQENRNIAILYPSF